MDWTDRRWYVRIRHAIVKKFNTPGGFPMITMLGSRRRLCDGMTRRETLKAGALSLLGGAFNLPSLLALEQNKHVRPGKAKSVILMYLLGGAPTQDMYDLKPNAPEKIRAEFKPIGTTVRASEICEPISRAGRCTRQSPIARS